MRTSDSSNPRADLIRRVGEQIDRLRVTRLAWAVAAVFGWAVAAYLLAS